jgi:hypothetical protein
MLNPLIYILAEKGNRGASPGLTMKDLFSVYRDRSIADVIDT